jgi:hypothetical protein
MCLSPAGRMRRYISSNLNAEERVNLEGERGPLCLKREGPVSQQLRPIFLSIAERGRSKRIAVRSGRRRRGAGGGKARLAMPPILSNPARGGGYPRTVGARPHRRYRLQLLRRLHTLPHLAHATFVLRPLASGRALTLMVYSGIHHYPAFTLINIKYAPVACRGGLRVTARGTGRRPARSCLCLRTRARQRRPCPTT